MALVVLALLTVTQLGLDRAEPTPLARPTASAPPSAYVLGEREASDAYAKLPLGFVPNAGQTDARVHYYAQTPGASFYLTPKEAVFAFSEGPADHAQGVVLRLGFLAANPTPTIEGRGPGGGTVNYLVGSDPSVWRTGLRTYEEVVYHDLWPGIDLVFRGQQGTLKYEFHLAPGARVSDIRLTYRGADRLGLGEDGDLLVHTPLGTLRDAPPVSYQVVDGRRVDVESRYLLTRAGGYGFAVGAGYDPRYPLIIDPGLAYSALLAGGATDQGSGIAVDARGHAYVAGLTGSVDFPTTDGAFDTTRNDSFDAFVAKLSPDGSGLVYSTFLGGTDFDQGLGIAVDPRGHAYVTGTTTSADFPTTSGTFDTEFNGVRDTFVTKLSPDGSALVYSTFLGGSDFDQGLGIAVDPRGYAYVTGQAASADFPTTPGTFDPEFNGGFADAFVTKLSSDGSALVYSTFLGSTGFDQGRAIAVDPQGHAYVTGTTTSADFPTTAGAFDRTLGSQDGFAAKLSPDGSGLVYSTFLGGTDSDQGFGIAVDPQGRAYITGRTQSNDFPTTPDAFDTALDGAADAFVTKLAPDGSALVYSTFLGGTDSDQGLAIAVDPRGHAFVTGTTNSADFPTTPGAFDTEFKGGFSGDAFVAKLSPDGSTLAYSTFLGGTNTDAGFGIAVDPRGHAYITGRSASFDFPATPGAFGAVRHGTFNVFVAKLDPR